jgi:hypothetical protein
MGEVLQCISHQIFSVGQNQCLLEQDLCVSATHSMEEWFIIQSFYHGLLHSARDHIDATAGGSFFALSIEEPRKLVQKMASNQSWDEEHARTHTHKVH